MEKYAAPVVVVVALVIVAAFSLSDAGAPADHGGVESGDSVDVTLHVMSQCPWGVKGIKAVLPVVEKLGGRANIKLEYIGRVSPEGELSSMHGESELNGNKIQLCVNENTTPDVWIAFVECQNRNYREIPDNWEQCAEENDVPMGPVRECYNGQQGTDLLRASFEKSTKSGARGSPTIFIGETKHEGGRSERALAQAICGAFEEEPPRYCAEIPPAPVVPVNLLVDARCDASEERGCNVDNHEKSVQRMIPGAKINRVDYGSDEGRELYGKIAKAGHKMLPAIVIGSEVAQDEEAHMQVKRRFKRAGKMFVNVVGRFDPSKGEWVPRPEVPVTVLSDERCTARECKSVDRFSMFIKRQLPGAKMNEIDYATEEGRTIWDRVVKALENDDSPRPRTPGLPLALFGSILTQEPEVYSRMKRRLAPVGEDFVYIAGRFDPTAEICDNETDDDGDNAVDCRDTDCAQQLVCRPEKAKQLTVFVMSECPFGVKALDSMVEVLANFKRDRTKIDFRVEFVGDVSKSGALSTMHGESELNENLREICAQQHYPDNYAFMDYISCRNKNLRGNWEECATGAIKADVIRTCAEGDEGQALLKASFDLANGLGFGASPTWMLNNNTKIQPRDPNSIKTMFCEGAGNATPECENELSKAPPRGPRRGGGGGGGGGGGSCG